jgi:hypothetical protein
MFVLLAGNTMKMPTIILLILLGAVASVPLPKAPVRQFGRFATAIVASEGPESPIQVEDKFQRKEFHTMSPEEWDLYVQSLWTMQLTSYDDLHDTYGSQAKPFSYFVAAHGKGMHVFHFHFLIAY